MSQLCCEGEKRYHGTWHTVSVQNILSSVVPVKGLALRPLDEASNSRVRVTGEERALRHKLAGGR
jgi:hypothetical protein